MIGRGFWLPAGLSLLVVFACTSANSGSPTAASSASPPASAAISSPAATSPAAGSPAPSITCAGRATPTQTEGPYFKAGSPESASLVDASMAGTRLAVSGRVLTLDCKPVAGAVLDFWQANAAGAYDNAGYGLRGHQATDSNGRFTLETIVPGEYPGRTGHIHVKVQAPGRQAVTTQLYFPGLARNQQDSLYDPALQMDVRDVSGGKVAAFDFILDLR